MKAISLWQPWATAVVLGSKRYETRAWPTSHRGRLLIHAAKRQDALSLAETGRHFWVEALGWDRVLDPRQVLPFGALIGSVELVDCVPATSLPRLELIEPRGRDAAGNGRRWFYEERLGDFRAGRWAWRLENPVRFDEPIPWRGRQRVFDVPWDGDPAPKQSELWRSDDVR